MALGFRPVCHMATRRAATNVLPECGGWRGVGHRPECPPLTRRTHDTSRTTEVFAAFVTSGVGVLAAFVTWPRGALLPTCCWNVKAGEVGASSGLPTTDSQTTQPVSHSDRSRSVQYNCSFGSARSDARSLTRSETDGSEGPSRTLTFSNDFQRGIHNHRMTNTTACRGSPTAVSNHIFYRFTSEPIERTPLHIHSKIFQRVPTRIASNSNSNADFYSPRPPSDPTRSNNFQHGSVKTSNSNVQSGQNPLEDH